MAGGPAGLEIDFDPDIVGQPAITGVAHEPRVREHRVMAKELLQLLFKKSHPLNSLLFTASAPVSSLPGQAVRFPLHTSLR